MLQVPYESGTNPWLTRFREAFDPGQVRFVAPTTKASQSRLPLWVGWPWPEFDFLMLHWFHVLYLRKGGPATALATGRFLLSLATLRASGVRLAWWVHNLESHDSPQPWADRLALKATARASSWVITGNDAAAHVVAAYYPHLRGRIHIIRCGPSRRLSTAIDQKSARDVLGLPTQGRIFAAAGLLRCYKNVPQLMDVFSSTFSGSEHFLVVAGHARDASDRAAVVAAYEALGRPANIILALRHLSDEEFETLLLSADVVVANYAPGVLNSGVVAQARELGRVVVVSDPTLVPDGVCVVAKPGDLGLASALSEADQLVDSGFGEYSSSTSTWTDMAEAGIALWREADKQL